MDTKVKITAEEFEKVREVLKLMGDLPPNRQWILVLNLSQTKCGFYTPEKSLTGYMNTLSTNKQAYLYIGDTNNSGELVVNKNLKEHGNKIL